MISHICTYIYIIIYVFKSTISMKYTYSIIRYIYYPHDVLVCFNT